MIDLVHQNLQDVPQFDSLGNLPGFPVPAFPALIMLLSSWSPNLTESKQPPELLRRAKGNGLRLVSHL